jgi:predicted metal-dependent hydrolase
MVWVLNGKIPIEIQWKNVKGINITVGWDGRVKVTAPENLDGSTIEKVLQRRAQWIESKLKEMRRRINSHPMPTLFVSGETIWVLGKPMTLEVQEGKGRVRMKSGKLVVQVEKVEREVVKAALVTWLLSLAQKMITERVEKFSRLVGVKPSGIKLRDWRRKWGLCRADRRTLRFNWRLVQLPEDLVDYIVVHELVHLKHPGHGKEFWDCMSKILPDYHQRKERLKEWISALLW